VAAGREAVRHVGIEPHAGDVEEQMSAELAGVDLRRRADERRSKAARGSNGRPSSRARPLPDPLGTTPSAASRSTSADATSFTVPSPPHAITTSTPRASAALREVARVVPPLGHEDLSGNAVRLYAGGGQPPPESGPCRRGHPVRKSG
jgi:hypothetical protein